MRREPEGSFYRDEEYHRSLLIRMKGWTNDRITETITKEIPTLVPQAGEHQTELKCSFDVPAGAVEGLREKIAKWIAHTEAPLQFVVSVDPATNQGLVDLLPNGVHKGFALAHWANRSQAPLHSIVFCGDSGNDTAAMKTGVRAVLVGNADQQLRSETALSNGRSEPSGVYCAHGRGPAGVLEGLRFHCLNFTDELP